MKFNLLCLEIQRRETETEKDKNKTNKQSNKTAKKKKRQSIARCTKFDAWYFIFSVNLHISHVTFRTSNFTLQMFLEYSRFCFMRDMWTAR